MLLLSILILILILKYIIYPLLILTGKFTVGLCRLAVKVIGAIAILMLIVSMAYSGT